MLKNFKSAPTVAMVLNCTTKLTVETFNLTKYTTFLKIIESNKWYIFCSMFQPAGQYLPQPRTAAKITDGGQDVKFADLLIL